MNTEPSAEESPAAKPSPPATESVAAGQPQEFDIDYIREQLQVKSAAGTDTATAWNQLAAEPPPGWDTQAWAREVNCVKPALSLLRKPDRLQSELIEHSFILGARANDPKIYREMVKHGQGHDLSRFGRVLKEKDIRKERRSEILCILRSPELTIRLIEETLSLRQALVLSRQNTAGKAKLTSRDAKKQTRARRRLHLQVEDALTALLCSIEKAAGCNVPWSIQLGPYLLTFEPKPPATQLTVS